MKLNLTEFLVPSWSFFHKYICLCNPVLFAPSVFKEGSKPLLR